MSSTSEIARANKLLPQIMLVQAARIRAKWRKVVTGDEKKRIRDLIKEKESEPKFVKLFDKVGFTLGVLHIQVCQYIVLHTPDVYWLWYCVVMPILLASRYWHFRSLSWHYFMFDFCYFVICCTFLYLFVLSSSALFFKIIFIFTNGPLTLAILLWRSSLVFHDFDKITSVYVHFLPTLLLYCERWYGHKSWSQIYSDNVYPAVGVVTALLQTNFTNAVADDTGSTFSTGQPVCGSGSFSSNAAGSAAINSFLKPAGEANILRLSDYCYAAALYLFWQIAYYLKTEVIDKDILDEHPEMLTSLRWMSADTKNAVSLAVLKLVRSMGLFKPTEQYDSKTAKTKIVFMTSQFFYTLLTFLPTAVVYHSQSLHFVYIVCIFTGSVYNGASYYMEVFSKRYNLQFIGASSNQTNTQHQKAHPSTATSAVASHSLQTDHLSSVPAVMQLASPSMGSMERDMSMDALDLADMKLHTNSYDVLKSLD